MLTSLGLVCYLRQRQGNHIWCKQLNYWDRHPYTNTTDQDQCSKQFDGIYTVDPHYRSTSVITFYLKEKI